MRNTSETITKTFFFKKKTSENTRNNQKNTRTTMENTRNTVETHKKYMKKKTLEK